MKTMDYLPPDALWNMWEPEDDKVRKPKKDRFEPYIGRNPNMAYVTLGDEQSVMKWLRSYLYKRFGREIKEIVDDRISWIVYDCEGKVIVRLSKDLVERMFRAWKSVMPIEKAEKLPDDPPKFFDHD